MATGKATCTCFGEWTATPCLYISAVAWQQDSYYQFLYVLRICFNSLCRSRQPAVWYHGGDAARCVQGGRPSQVHQVRCIIIDDAYTGRRSAFDDLAEQALPPCRIVTDRETGKQKGFAFIEYYEAQTAQSAVRNLDQADLTGRKLKVTFAQKDIDSSTRQPRGAASAVPFFCRL